MCVRERAGRRSVLTIKVDEVVVGHRRKRHTHTLTGVHLQPPGYYKELHTQRHTYTHTHRSSVIRMLT